MVNNADLARLPVPLRHIVYRALVVACKTKIAEKVSVLKKQYDMASNSRRIGQFEMDLSILKRCKLIGLTTTGFSKYRALICATKARVIVLEEAGESLECTVAPLFIPSLEQLIQVGDHKQLRPRPQKRVHQGMNWGISLFERLVSKNVDMIMLRKQRRMRSEISRLLRPVYGTLLQDFEKEDLRPVVPGMGGVNTWFFDHRARESKDSKASTMNEAEATMIAGFAGYLITNGVPPTRISVLTFYNGQKRCLLKHLRKLGVGVYTVDSYQGEENDIVLLSLVRSNEAGHVGFLDNDNRVNVALSRAKLGLFIFGNRSLLEKRGGPLWVQIFQILDDRGHPDTRFSRTDEPCLRAGTRMYLVCGCGVATHEADQQACGQQCQRGHAPMVTAVACADDFAELLDGGCRLKCGEELPCKHGCPLNCHP